MSEEIVVRGTVLPLTEAAREKFAQSQIDLIAASKAKGADLPTLHAYLELASRYELDPFANEIWCANMSGPNATRPQMAILVGRDGYMKIAKRDAEFVVCSGQAVYEKDTFAAEYVDDETGWKVEHKIGNPAARGNLLGGWAKLVRTGKPTEFFFAPIGQFRKNGGAWGYTDAMIVKCAVSYLLRTTYNISGPAPADELAVGFDATADAVEESAAPPALPEAIAKLLDRARSLNPQAWRENEVVARLDGSEEATAAVEAEITAWLAVNEPEEAEVVEGGEVDPAPAPAEPGEPAVEPEPEPQPEVEEPEGESLETVEMADLTPDERYERDTEWREKVDVLLHRRADLEASANDVDGQDAAEVLAELDHVETELDKLGSPRGWSPGQATLEV